MKTKFLAATILSIGLTAVSSVSASSRDADVEMNLGALKNLNSGYQAPSAPVATNQPARRRPVYQPYNTPQYVEPTIDQRLVNVEPTPKAKPKYKPRKVAKAQPVSPAPAPQVAVAAPAAEAPLNAPLPANYNPAMFAPKGPSMKITAQGGAEIEAPEVAEIPPPVAPAPMAAAPVAPAPLAVSPTKIADIPAPLPLPAAKKPAAIAPVTEAKKLAEIPAPLPLPESNKTLIAPPVPVAPPAPVKLSEMPRRTPEAQGNVPASALPTPPALPPVPEMPKLAALPKTDVKPSVAKSPVDAGTLNVKPLEPNAKLSAVTPPPPPPLVITPDNNEIKTDSKPLLSPKDAVEAPKLATLTPPAPPAPPALPAAPAAKAPAPVAALTPPPAPPAPAAGKLAMPPMPPAPPLPDLKTKVAAQTAKLNEQPKLAEIKDDKSPLAALPPIPAPPAPPSIKDLPPLPTTTKAAQTADLAKPPVPSQLPSLDKLFEKKDDVPALPPAKTVATKEAVTVQTAGLPEAAPVAPAVATPGSVSIPYAEAEVEIPPSEQAKLQAIADSLAADKTSKVNISAYASGTEDQVALALRTSFGRAVKIRKFFIDRNISEDRINVKALGNKSTSGVPDRVDVSVGKSG
jgi:outer membrane protein OmpA-like peptidoglycan-associated protein